MKAKYYPSRNCYRVIVPARLSQTGREQQLYFKKKEDAEAKIREFVIPSQRLIQINSERQHFLETAERTFESLDQMIEAGRHYRSTILSVNKKATLEEAASDFIYIHCQHEELNPRTIADRRRCILRLSEAMGPIQCTDLTAQKLRDYLAPIKAGSTRKSHRKNISPFIGWLKTSGYLATNLMDDVPSTDRWGVNDEYLQIDIFRRILFVCAGLEQKQPTDYFKRLLPFYVLRGLAGMRRCEIISSHPGDSVIEWTDILWQKNLIYVRDEVAKQTQAKDRKRLIPLEPAARQWLEMVAKPAGPMIEISQSTLQRLQAELFHKIKVKMPENALRNSYATYALTFRSMGDVAKAMGDLESTVKRFYVGDILEAETGREWFNQCPNPEPAAGKILQIEAA